MLKGNKSRNDFIFVYVAYTLRYLYLLLLIPFYGRVLGVEGYAVVLAAMSLTAVIWRFAEWGFSTAGMRSIAVLEPSRYAQLFSEHIVGRLILSGLACIVGFIAVISSPLLSANPIASGAAVLLGAFSAFNLGWYYTGSGRARSAVKLEVIGFIVSLVLVFSLVRGSDDASMVMISLLISSVIALVIAHYWIKEEISGANYNFPSGIKLIKNTSVIFFYTGSSTLLVASSTYILSIISTAAEVGSFGAAERLITVGLSIMGPAGQIFLPRITALLIQNENDAYSLIRKAMFFMLGIGFIGLVFSWVFGGIVINIIFGGDFDSSIIILKWLSLMFPIAAFNLILSSYVLLPQHQEKILAKTMILSGAISIAVSIPLGYHYGAMGMVAARLLGEVIICTCLIVACWKLGFIKKIFAIQKKNLLT